MAHAAPGAVAPTLTPRQIQSYYESSIFHWLDFLSSYSRAIASRDLQALGALQKRARQALEGSFGAKTGDILAEPDRIDRQARTGRPRTNIGTRLFDFREGEKFEYELNAEDSPKGNLLIRVDRISGDELRFTIQARLGKMSVERQVTYNPVLGSQEVTGGLWADNDLGRRLVSLLFPPDATPPGETGCSSGSINVQGRAQRLGDGNSQCVDSELPLPIWATPPARTAGSWRNSCATTRRPTRNCHADRNDR